MVLVLVNVATFSQGSGAKMIGSLISAGAGILGGLLGKSSADKAAEMNAQLARENIALQKEFAQSGIQWKVADAKAAGIHPLYGLGASTPTFSPVSANFTADASMPNALAAAGQDIGRAVNATRSASQRNNAFDASVRALTVEKMGLENELLRSQIARTSGAQGNPPMPVGDRYLIPGQAQSGVLVNDKPQERVNVDPSAPHSEPGAVADVGPVRTSQGLTLVPSKDVKERIEDSPYEWGHFWRNMVLPTFSNDAQQRLTSGFPKPRPGHYWKYIPLKGEYQEVPYDESLWSRLRRNWN